MRVLDGGVAIYDAVSGVEAQSETVWHQVCHWGVASVACCDHVWCKGRSLRLNPAPVHSKQHDRVPLLDRAGGEVPRAPYCVREQNGP